MIPVAGGHPQLLLGEHRAGNFLVTVLFVDAAPEGKQGVVHLPAAGQPIGHTGSGGIHHKQVQLGAELLVVALQRFLDEGLVRLELVPGGEGPDVNALQHILVLVAAPVRAGQGVDFIRHAHQLLAVFHVGAAAQVDKVVAGPVDRNGLVLRQLFDQLRLILLALENLQRFGAGDLLAGPGFAALDDFLHLFFDLREILLGDGSGQQEIVVQPVRDLRADGVLHFLAVHLDHGLGQDVRQRMPVHAEKLFLIHT